MTADMEGNISVWNCYNSDAVAIYVMTCEWFSLKARLTNDGPHLTSESGISSQNKIPTA